MLHSFFAWAEYEGPGRGRSRVGGSGVPRNESRPSERPTYPRTSSGSGLRRHCSNLLLGILLMEGVGPPATPRFGRTRWRDTRSFLNLGRDHTSTGRGVIMAVGSDRDPDVLRGSSAAASARSSPNLDDYVFTVEVEQWVSSTDRRKSVDLRTRSDPAPSIRRSRRMVKRVCRRAGIPRGTPPTRFATVSATASSGRATRI